MQGLGLCTPCLRSKIIETGIVSVEVLILARGYFCRGKHSSAVVIDSTPVPGRAQKFSAHLYYTNGIFHDMPHRDEPFELLR